MTSKKNEKYHLILEGALKVFAEHGYHGSQVSKIARAAGVADGTIYLYFKRKEDILISLFQEKLGVLVDNFRKSIEGTDDSRLALRKVCESHFNSLEEDVNLAYVTQIELRQSNLELRKEIGEAVKPYYKLIEDLLVKGIEQGVFRKNLDVKLTRHLIFGAMDEVVTSWLVSGRKFSLSSQADGAVEFFLKAIEA